MPVERVHIIQRDTTGHRPGNDTAVSQTPTNFNEENLALAAATAREALLGLGGSTNVPVDRLTKEQRRVKDDQSKRVTKVSWLRTNVCVDAQSNREAETGKRMDGARKAFCGHARWQPGDSPPQRPRSGNAARSGRSTVEGRCTVVTVDEAPTRTAWRGQSRRPQEFCRRRHRRNHGRRS